jgi:hypothetical protein
VLTPDAVLGPARPGRKVVIAADTAFARSVVDAARATPRPRATFAEEEQARA